MPDRPFHMVCQVADGTLTDPDGNVVGRIHSIVVALSDPSQAPVPAVAAEMADAGGQGVRGMGGLSENQNDGSSGTLGRGESEGGTASGYVAPVVDLTPPPSLRPEHHATYRSVMEALGRFAAAKEAEAPKPHLVAKYIVRYRNRDQIDAVQRCVWYFTEGRGAKRPVKDVTATWRNWLVNADPRPLLTGRRGPSMQDAEQAMRSLELGSADRARHAEILSLVRTVIFPPSPGEIDPFTEQPVMQADEARAKLSTLVPDVDAAVEQHRAEVQRTSLRLRRSA